MLRADLEELDLEHWILEDPSIGVVVETGVVIQLEADHLGFADAC